MLKGYFFISSFSGPQPTPQIFWMHVENVGQSGSDSNLGIVNQIRMAEVARVMTLCQWHTEQLVESDWQVRFD